MKLSCLTFGLGLLCWTIVSPMSHAQQSSHYVTEIEEKNSSSSQSESRNTKTVVTKRHSSKPISRWAKRNRLTSGVQLNSLVRKNKAAEHSHVSKNRSLLYPWTVNEKLSAHRNRTSIQPRLKSLRLETTKRRKR